MLQETEKIKDHYEAHWHSRGILKRWAQGPVWELPESFCINVFEPNSERKLWTYATCGMSLLDKPGSLELHLHSRIETDSHVELLTAIAHYHLTEAILGLWHTVNFGRPWFPGSQCEYGLLSRPYLDGPSLEWAEIASRTTRFLWLIPITESEREYKKMMGIEALEERLEDAEFDYSDPDRLSVV